MVALGQRRRLVAVTRYCHRLVDVSGLPQLDTTWSVKAGEVAALKPDLVLAATPYRAGKIDELLKARLNVLCLYPQSLADVYAHIIWLGWLSQAPAQAEEIVAGMKAELAALQARAAGQNSPRRRVYVEEWPKPCINGAPWIAEIVEMLGAEFTPKPAGRQVAEAEVVETDPEVIILNWAGVDKIDPDRVMNRPGWEQISAVQARRVVAVNEILLNAPGPNLVEGAQEVWRALYPGVAL